MTDTLHTNPLREGLVSRATPRPCSIVIFGATGDLTHRKLVPALYNLAADGDLPAGLNVVGFARREKPDETFRAELEEAARKYSRQSINDELWKNFQSSIYYHRSEFNNPEGYQRLRERLDKIDQERGSGGNRLFYLSAGPDQFEPILTNLKDAGLNEAQDGSWARVIVEKPFGIDLATAEHLNSVVHQAFAESATFRIDHYLGKETAQNIMVLRFANALFEHLWNQRYIDHIQITASEQLGVEGRAGYYEGAGALRDMVQNHLLQLLCLIAMEPPTDLSADAVRDEKVKVLRSLRRIRGADVNNHVVRGQYSAGSINGKAVPAYREEKNVKPESETETYAALRILVDNWRWSNVPFYVRVGKRLPKGGTEIGIHFKNAPEVLFNRDQQNVYDGSQNVLVIRIQPDEGVSLRMQSKVPGNSVRIQPVKMDFSYGTSFGKASPEAYERLLLDSMAGDATLFARRDEVEEAWRFIDDIEVAWHQGKSRPPLNFYAAGSWGPSEADQLIEADGRAWRRL
ncbi:MAG TPA: glucose-6-phosphate dehydrogenase [Chthoniobacterales bacterium]